MHLVGCNQHSFLCFSDEDNWLILPCAWYIVIIDPWKVTLFTFIPFLPLIRNLLFKTHLFTCTCSCAHFFCTPLNLCKWYWAMYLFSFLLFSTTQAILKFCPGYYVYILAVSSSLCLVCCISLSTSPVMNARLPPIPCLINVLWQLSAYTIP